MQKLVEDYKDIYDCLLGLEAHEKIDYNYLHDLLSLTTRLIEVVAGDSENIKREVNLMGGGKVLEMESEKIHNDGIAQGIAQSILSLLETKGALSDNLQEQIMSEKRDAILKEWLLNASAALSVEEFVQKMK